MQAIADLDTQRRAIREQLLTDALATYQQHRVKTFAGVTLRVTRRAVVTDPTAALAAVRDMAITTGRTRRPLVREQIDPVALNALATRYDQPIPGVEVRDTYTIAIDGADADTAEA